jgi:GT2 family glycosyltransferase
MISSDSIKKIAVLITVYNRKEKTLRCLNSLFNCYLKSDYELNVFLVNDGCTDGTYEAIQKAYPQVNIIQGNGNLFWNRGVILAWNTAVKTFDYDYYMWLNDDVIIYNMAISELLKCAEETNNIAIIVGSTCTTDNTNRITYGGRIRRYGLITPNGKMQKCDCFNGQIVLIPKSVYLKLGTNDTIFHHAFGDFDYGFRAQNMKIESLVAPSFLGECDENTNDNCQKWRNSDVPFFKRLKLLYSPLGKNPVELYVYTYRAKGFISAFAAFLLIHFELFLKIKNR